MQVANIIHGLVIDFAEASRFTGERHYSAAVKALEIVFSVIASLFPNAEVQFFRKAWRKGEDSGAETMVVSCLVNAPVASIHETARILYEHDDFEFCARIAGNNDIELTVIFDPIYFRFTKIRPASQAKSSSSGCLAAWLRRRR